MKQSIKQLVLGATSIALLTVTSQAAVLAAYNFNTPGGTPIASTVDPKVTANDFITSTADTNQGFSGAGNVFIRSLATAATQSAALDSRYFAFTVSATSLTDELDLDQLSATLTLTTDNTTSTTNNLYLQSSVGGFGSSNPIISGTGTSLTRTTSGTSTSTATFDLTGVSFQGLSGDVEFRFYISDNVDENGKINRLDNVSLTGDVIPEPSAALLGGLGLLALLRRRR